MTLGLMVDVEGALMRYLGYCYRERESMVGLERRAAVKEKGRWDMNGCVGR